MSEINLFGQKLYLSPILHSCSKAIVSYTIFSDRPALSMETLLPDKAFARIPGDSTF